MRPAYSAAHGSALPHLGLFMCSVVSGRCGCCRPCFGFYRSPVSFDGFSLLANLSLSQSLLFLFYFSFLTQKRRIRKTIASRNTRVVMHLPHVLES